MSKRAHAARTSTRYGDVAWAPPVSSTRSVSAYETPRNASSTSRKRQAGPASPSYVRVSRSGRPIAPQAPAGCGWRGERPCRSACAAGRPGTAASRRCPPVCPPAQCSTNAGSVAVGRAERWGYGAAHGAYVGGCSGLAARIGGRWRASKQAGRRGRCRVAQLGGVGIAQRHDRAHSAHQSLHRAGLQQVHHIERVHGHGVLVVAAHGSDAVRGLPVGKGSIRAGAARCSWRTWSVMSACRRTDGDADSVASRTSKRTTSILPRC